MSDRAIPSTALVVIAPDVLSSELGPEHVLLSLRDGMYYGLDAVGGEIWKMLQNPVSVADICRGIVDLYDVEPARCRCDVEALLADLAGRQLVEIRCR